MVTLQPHRSLFHAQSTRDDTPRGTDPILSLVYPFRFQLRLHRRRRALLIHDIAATVVWQLHRFPFHARSTRGDIPGGTETISAFRNAFSNSLVLFQSSSTTAFQAETIRRIAASISSLEACSGSSSKIGLPNSSIVSDIFLFGIPVCRGGLMTISASRLILDPWP